MQKFEVGKTVKDQETFSEDKYVDLAGSNPVGLRLRKLVEAHWIEWVAQVATAPWLRNWQRSQLLGCEGCTPEGHRVTPKMIEDFRACNGLPEAKDLSAQKVANCGEIAIVIFSSAVWGFGLDGWLRNSKLSLRPFNEFKIDEFRVSGVDVLEVDALKDRRGGRVRVNHAMAKVLELQGVKSPNAARTYFWDDRLYRGSGISLPCEYCDLDRWLEGLYQDALFSQ